MAFPPRFGMQQFSANTFIPSYGAVPVVSMVPATHYLMPTLQGGVITSAGPRTPMRRKEPPYEKPPVTTVFVGNIHERASNDLVKSLLQKCGNIIQWKRIQGPNGKFQAFGFCEFDHPDSTLRAVRLLNDFCLGDKKLVVKCDEKTRELLKEYINKRRQQTGKGPLQTEGDQLPCDDNMKREDPSYQKALCQLVQDLVPELAITPGFETNIVTNVRRKSPTLSGKGGNLDIESLDREKKEYIAREINLFRQQHKDDKDVKPNKSRRHDRSRTPKSREPSPVPVAEREDDQQSRVSRKRERTPDSPRSSHSRASSMTGRQLPLKKPSSKGRKRESSRESGRSSRNRRQSRSRSRLRDSEDEEEAFERKRIERKVREKEAAYQERLKKWETRERKKTKEYEKEKTKQKEKRREELREAKKLKEFFEDYDDERDDVKYYKGKSYEYRRREFEREREVDAKDRQKEKEELDEIKKKLLEDGISNPDEEINKMQKEQEEKLLKRLRADSSESPSPVRPQKVDITSSEGSTPATNSTASDDESESKSKQADLDSKDDKSWRSVGVDQAKPVGKGLLGFAGLKLAAGGGSGSGQGAAKNAFVDPSTVDDDDNLHGASTSRKRLVPLEYSEEENQALLFDSQAQQSMSAEDKRKAIKNLIEKIPTSKDELFAYAISWSHVDAALIEKRLKPWINKKIVEYIGEEEPTLVEFICQKIAQKSNPQSILEDISMVLDEEASVFVVKLWRLLIYEIEAKRFGLVKVETPA